MARSTNTLLPLQANFVSLSLRSDLNGLPEKLLVELDVPTGTDIVSILKDDGFAFDDFQQEAGKTLFSSATTYVVFDLGKHNFRDGGNLREQVMEIMDELFCHSDFALRLPTVSCSPDVLDDGQHFYPAIRLTIPGGFGTDLSSGFKDSVIGEIAQRLNTQLFPGNATSPYLEHDIQTYDTEAGAVALIGPEKAARLGHAHTDYLNAELMARHYADFLERHSGLTPSPARRK